MYQFFFNISLIFGAELDRGGSASSRAETGGLVASGDGTATGYPKVEPEGLLNPRLVADGGGLVALVGGAVPALNSAQRGHFRFVSKEAKKMRLSGQGYQKSITHVTHLTTMTTTSLQIESARPDGGEGICAIPLYQVLRAGSGAWVYLPPSQS